MKTLRRGLHFMNISMREGKSGVQVRKGSRERRPSISVL